MEASWIKVVSLYFVISFDSFLESLFEHVEFSLVFFKSRIGIIDKILCGRLKLVNVVNNFDGEGDFSLNFLIDGVMSFIFISNVVTKLNLDHLMKVNFRCRFFFFCSIRVELVDIILLFLINLVIFVKNKDGRDGIIERNSRSEIPNHLITGDI